MIGIALMSNLAMVGGSASVGSCARMASTLSLTSIAARSGSTPSSNSTTAVETLSCENESSDFTLAIVLIASSTRSVTCDSTSAGPAPG